MSTTIKIRKSGLIPFQDFSCKSLVICRLNRYRPLESSTHIRILHLKDGGEGEPLRCKIEHVDLQRKPSYQAISYVWGSSNKPFWIEVDDGLEVFKIPLTASLNHALRDLRSVCKSGSNIFWADAICINQADTAERSKQVRFMGRIYSEAASVITYIGPASLTDYKGLDLARQILEYADSHQDQPPDPRLRVRVFHNQVGFPDSQNPLWETLGSLLKREWPTRAWMVQEFLLNRKLLMLCGRKYIPWNTFLQFPRLVADGRIPGGFVGSTMGTVLDNLSVLEVLRTARQENPDLKMTMLELLQWCHVMSSTDARDKIYSVLGLTCDQLDIIPDYSTSIAQVYQDIAVRILNTHPTLDILSSAHGNKSLKLPSWVPDWSFWSDDIPVPLVHDVTFSKPCFYDACAGAKPIIKFNARYSRLTVHGVVLDHISFSSGKLGDRIFPSAPEQQGETFYRFQHLLKELRGWRESLPQTLADEVFWRTLIANVVYEQREAGSEVGEWFSAYMHFLCSSGWSIPMSEPAINLAHKFFVNMFAKVERRSLCTTERGYLCLAPPDAEVGDSLCILLGGRVPYILRLDDGGAYILVGESYVHGFMKGEALKNDAAKDSSKDFELV
ncbi:hypothetical protein B7463_g3139, partial [Scytalidium lignicola]